MFAAEVVIQVFLIGLSFTTTLGYAPHIEFAHTLGPVVLSLIVLALVGRLPRKYTFLTLLLNGLFALQYLFANLMNGLIPGVGWVFAFHPVNALAIFWLTVYLARQARGCISASPAPPGVPPQQAIEPFTQTKDQ